MERTWAGTPPCGAWKDTWYESMSKYEGRRKALMRGVKGEIDNSAGSGNFETGMDV